MNQPCEFEVESQKGMNNQGGRESKGSETRSSVAERIKVKNGFEDNGEESESADEWSWL